MANSSLLGIEPLIPQAQGHDHATLGPGDSSDSGSDLTGLDTPDPDDPSWPNDPDLAPDIAIDAGASPDADGGDRWQSADGAGAGATVEDESADPVGDGQSDAALAAGLPPLPGQPNPAPDPPDGTSPLDPDGEAPVPDDDRPPRTPGRDPGLVRR